MAKAKYQRGVHPRARTRARETSRGRSQWKRWVLVAAAMLGVAALVYLAQTTGGSGQDSETAALARENAGTEVRFSSHRLSLDRSTADKRSAARRWQAHAGLVLRYLV
jgi:hypothetical protein